MSVWREVFGLSGIVYESNGAVRPAVVVEFRQNNLAVRNKLTVLPDFLPLNVVVVVNPYIENKVDIPRENSRDVHNQFVGKAGGSRAFKQ